MALAQVNVFQPGTGNKGVMDPHVDMIYYGPDGTGVITEVKADGIVKLSHNNQYTYPYFVFVDYAQATGTWGFGLPGSGMTFANKTYEGTAHA
jgi:hypothetical protein